MIQTEIFMILDTNTFKKRLNPYCNVKKTSNTLMFRKKSKLQQQIKCCN
jgi:hypothetical protein